MQPEGRSGWVVLRETTEKFFGFYFASLLYFFKLCCNFLRVIIPLILHTILWAITTVMKMVLLFFAMILLVIGPRIGLPNAVYQSTWRLLLRTGAVTPSSISRMARRNRQQQEDDPSAPPAEPETPAELAGELILVGYERMDVMLAATVVTDTVQDVVKELFWTAVDALGVGDYFRSVCRYKERLRHPRRQSHSHLDSDEEVEEVYSEAQGGWIRRGSRQSGGGRRSPAEEEEEEEEIDGGGAMLAMVLHKGEETTEWALEATQHWWAQRKVARAERRRQKTLHTAEQVVAGAERVRDREQANLLSLEGQAAFCCRRVEQAERDVAYWTRETREAETKLAQACADLEGVRRGGESGKAQGWFGGWGRSEEEQLQDEVDRLEVWLAETASEFSATLQRVENRKRDSVAMLAQMRVSERLLEKAEDKYKQAVQSYKKVLKETYPERCLDQAAATRRATAPALAGGGVSGREEGGGEGREEGAGVGESVRGWRVEAEEESVGERGPESDAGQETGNLNLSGNGCVHRGSRPSGPVAPAATE